MASSYSTNLALDLMATGDQSGTWGTTTNTNLGTLLEQAISGYVTQAITDGADTTITIPNGATGVARNMVIEMTGALTAARNLIVPANRKLYFIYNNTSGGYAVTVKVTGLTGVSVPNGKKVLLASNGTDIVEQFNQVVGNLAVGGTLGVTGVATMTAAPVFSSATASLPMFTDGSKALVSNAMTGTGNVVMSASPTLTGTIAGASQTLSGTLGVTGVATLGNGAILNTPASMTGTNITGTAAAFNINGTVGATTPAAATVTALTASSDSSFTSTGAVKIPASTTANRPSTGVTGQIRYNTSLSTFEGYGAAAWGSIGGGATGAGGDTVFQENQLIVTTSYTLSTGKSAMSVGPITINSGAAVTIPSGYRWLVL